MEGQIKNLTTVVRECSQQVMRELGPGWKEETYQKAMEVALRHRGVTYENQRVLPISFAEHTVGESFPDLVIWLKHRGKKIAIVIDLKAEPGIKAEHKTQVERYIKELKKQLHANEYVHPVGLVINFAKDANNKFQDKDRVEDLGGVQVLEFKTK